MKNGATMDKAIKLLKGHYYGNIILLAVVFLLILFRIVPLFADGQAVNVTAERYAIMITILAIPVSLKFFAYRLKKIPRPVETVAATEKYKNASFLRLYTISAVTLMHIMLFGISLNMNFFWFTVVLFIVFLFCKPSYEELESLTEVPGEQNLPEEEEQQLQEEQLHPNQPYGEHSQTDDRKAGEVQEEQFEEIQNNYPENEQVTGK